MKRRLIRAALLGAALALAGFVLAASGVIPVKASAGHWPITAWFLRFALQRSVATHSLGTEVPSNLGDPALVQMGAMHYDFACRMCHGEPGRPTPRVLAHMLPPPPDLAPRVGESDPRKLYYIVKHGVKFTGMPAWPAPQRDDEVWAMVAFLLEYPDLDPAAYRQIAGHGELLPDSPVVPAAARSCVRCHGRDGLSRDNPAMPYLAGQRAAYLRKALDAYAAGRRHSGTMEPAAAEVAMADREELARHFAGLRREDSGRGPVDPAAVARGERIAHEGIPAQRVPACIECHGRAARRGKPEFPLLAGQRAGYLERQLALLREDRRGGADHVHLMQPIAARLTPGQARDAAHYFASLPVEPSPP